MSSDLVVSASHLSKAFQIYSRYDDRLKQVLFGRWKTFYNEFWVLHDVSLEIRKGECVAFVGRNGSGKTTLLQMICGITKPTTGNLIVRGRIAPILALGSAFDFDLSGRENLYIAGAILGMKRQVVAERMEKIREFAGIGDYFDQPAKLYSSGMLARIALAICVNSDPDILIVDEALAVGDGAFQERSRQFIADYVKRGTLLMVSHDMEQIERFCNRVVWVDRGRLRMVGPPSEVLPLYNRDLAEAPDTGDRFTFNIQPEDDPVARDETPDV